MRSVGARVQERCRLGVAASPDEIAAAVVFLASPLSAYTTGAILTIDGGLTGGREVAR